MKRVISLLLTMFMVIMITPAAFANSNASPAANTYSDIAGGWFEDAVTSYGYAELFSNGDGCFYPDQSVTRMEFVRLLHKALNIQMNYFAATDISEYYDDVSNNDPGAGDLYDLVTCGIADAREHFNPSGLLERDEMIHMVINAVDYFSGGTQEDSLVTVSFADDSQINADYRTDVYRAVNLKLVYGKGNNQLSPRQAATRAEAVTIAARLAALVENTQSGLAVSAAAEETDGQFVMTLSLKNNTDQTIAIEHTSGQKYDFIIYGSTGETLYCWSADKMFTMALTTTEIPANEEIVFTEILDPQIYSAIKDSIHLVKAFVTGTSGSSIDPNGYIASLS